MKKTGAIMVIATMLALSACSDSTDGGTPVAADSPSEAAMVVSSTPSPSFCDSVETLQASLQSLKDMDVIAEGTDALQVSVDQIKSDLEAVGASGADLVGDDVEMIKTSVDSLQGSIDNIKSGTPIKDEAVGISADLASIAQAGEAIVTTAKSQDCGIY
jgi:hypothetical protein